MATVRTPVIYMEEILYKRSRGRHPSRVKKTQKRFCRLTEDSFEYFEPPKKGDTVSNKAPNGDFPVSRIRIVEKLDCSFKKGKHWFQFGDDKEVIYLGAESEDKQHEWIKALKKAATDSQNEMISHYHPSPYTGGKWSCCKGQTKQCQGCELSHSAESDDQQHSRQTSHQTRHPSDLSCTSNSSEETITESLGSKRPSRTSTGSLNASWSQQSTTTLTSVSENENGDHDSDGEVKEQETTYDKPQNDDVSRLRTESSADSGIGSELSSRSNSTSASVGQIKKRSLKQTWSLGHVLDEDVAESNDLAKKHQSQPNLHVTSHKSDPGHKESLLCDQVLSKLTSKGGKLHSVCEEEEQTDSYTLFQCFTSPTQNIVQALKFYGPDKLISTSYGDSYVHIWDVSGFKPVQSVKVSSSVLALDVWSHYLAIGSNVAQIVDISSDELRRTIFVEDNEGIPSSSLPSQLVAFVGEEGHLATARANSKVIKFWPPPSLTSKVMTSPEACITLAGQIQGISATHNSKTPLLAVIMEVKEICCKSVCLIDLKRHEVYKKLISGSGKLSVGIDVASSPEARYISVGIDHKVDVCEARSGADLFHVNTLKTGSSVHSLVYSNDGSKLAVGLSTGEVKVFDPTSNHHLFTHGDPVTCTEVYHSPATSLTYSGDDELFAVGYQNGVLKLWKASTGLNDATSHCLESPLSTVHGMDPELYNDLEPLLVRAKTLAPQFSKDGIYEYQSIEDDFKVIIPEGAIVRDHKVQVAVMKYGPIGPFEYPDGYEPVSPIVWLCSSQKKFYKNLEIILPHCSALGNSDDEANQTQLVFLKAGHNEYIRNTNGQKVFQFKQVDLQTSFEPNSSYGSLHINHCCFYCVGKYMRKDTDQANFCLIVAKPHTTTKKYTISICLTFDLPTCRKAVREQFEECDFIEIRPVRFAQDKHNAILEIKLNRQLAADAGWLITLQSQKIKTKDVSSFWDLPSCKDLVEACQSKLYPPRFTIEVSAKRATKDTFVEVWFDGAVDEHRTEIQLECPTELAPVYVGPPDPNHTPEVLLNGNNTEFETAAEGTGIASSEQEKSEASGLLLPMIKSFNGFVQEPFKTD